MCMYASNGTTKWFTPLTVGSLSGNAPLTPALSADEKTVYFHAGTGFLFAVDTDTGSILWNVTTASSVREGFYSAPAVDADGNMYVRGCGSRATPHRLPWCAASLSLLQLRRRPRRCHLQRDPGRVTVRQDAMGVAHSWWPAGDRGRG